MTVVSWRGVALESGDVACLYGLVQPEGEAGVCYAGAGDQDVESWISEPIVVLLHWKWASGILAVMNGQKLPSCLGG